MRIRKNASKLLGSPFYLPSSSSDFAHSEVEKPTVIVCELNSNPRDSLEFDDSIYYNNVANLKEEDDDEGILGNSIILHDVVEPISVCLEGTLPSITKYELKSTTEAASVKKKRGRKKKNNNEEVTVEKETYNNTNNINNSKCCKKTDGKGWYCKREVEPPSTLCSYHIAQLRTYTTSHSLTKSTCIAPEKVAMVDESSSLYYYYDGFGPCNGKRRDKVEYEVAVASEKFDDGNGGENNIAIIAGDDEYDNDVFGFEKIEDDDGGGEYCEVEKKNVKEMEVLEEKKKVLKKRGRKPIKARSLKSIL